MRIAMGADHRGYPLKEALKVFLQEEGHEILDFGTHSPDSTDYPDHVIPAAEAVARGEADFGIVICMTGEGACISANKVKGVRAAWVIDEELAHMARAHNNANVMCLPGGRLDPETAKKLVKVFLSTPFEGGRHERRIRKIHRYEDSHSCGEG